MYSKSNKPAKHFIRNFCSFEKVYWRYIVSLRLVHVFISIMSATQPVNTIIELQDITKHFKLGPVVIKALNGITLQIARNEYVALIGAVGVGKINVNEYIGLFGYTNNRQLYFKQQGGSPNGRQ